MILAHGPLGYLIGYHLQKRYHFAKRWLWFAAVGGLFPDVDLFYFYFVNAAVSHHQLITHSLIPYVIVLGIGYFIKPIRGPVMLFAGGAISHVLADVLTGYVGIFTPFSTLMVGLPTWGYSLAAGGMMELVILLMAAATFVTHKRRFFIYGTVGLIGLAIIFVWINQHSYKLNAARYYSAIGNRDVDGDGLVNMIDPDIDNDGEDNSVELYLELFSAEGALFDYSYGNFIEVPLRVGLVNDVVMVQRLFANVGIVMGEEMTHDYAVRPDGYSYEPTDYRFAEQPHNIMNWLHHTQHLLPADAPRQEFDVIFFESGYLALFTRVDGEDVVLDVDPSHPLAEYRALSEVMLREGGIKAIGRILPKPYSKRY